MIAGVTYLMSQDGSYSKKTTTSDGKTCYQAVPAPQGATHHDAAGDARARDRSRAPRTTSAPTRSTGA